MKESVAPLSVFASCVGGVMRDRFFVGHPVRTDNLWLAVETSAAIRCWSARKPLIRPLNRLSRSMYHSSQFSPARPIAIAKISALARFPYHDTHMDYPPELSGFSGPTEKTEQSCPIGRENQSHFPGVDLIIQMMSFKTTLANAAGFGELAALSKNLSEQ